MISLSLFRNEQTKDFSAGQVIFQTGEEGNIMYVVTEGEVDILVGNVVVETVTPGGVFGEMALIDKTLRSATAVARTDAKVAAIDQRRFQFLVTQTPYFALQVMSIMAGRLRKVNERLISAT
jgi:CRP/FNR family cyclic AMP-dependent transcriptional regulator